MTDGTANGFADSTIDHMFRCDGCDRYFGLEDVTMLSTGKGGFVAGTDYWCDDFKMVWCATCLAVVNEGASDAEVPQASVGG